MKKILTLLLLSLTLSFSQAQVQVPNGGFESWIDAYNATSWGSVSFLGVNSFFRTTTVNSGTYAGLCRTTDTVMFTQHIVVPGIATLGTVNVATQNVTGGIPCTDKPDEFRGYFRYAPQGIDTMNILIYLWEWNSALSRQDTVATGRLDTSATINTFTAFNIPLEWNAGYVGTPDSMNIVLLSSGFVPAGNSRAIFDDFSLYYLPVGLEVSLNDMLTELYPNPASERVNISAPAETRIELYNNLGEKVMSTIATGQLQELQTSDFPRGLYFIRYSKEGASSTSKLILQ